MENYNFAYLKAFVYLTLIIYIKIIIDQLHFQKRLVNNLMWLNRAETWLAHKMLILILHNKIIVNSIRPVLLRVSQTCDSGARKLQIK